MQLLVGSGRPGVGLEGRPDRRGGVGQSGIRGSEWDAEVFGDLRHGQPEGIPEYKDGALVRWKSSEAAVQLVAVVDRQERVGVGRSVGLSRTTRPRSAGRDAPRRSRR